MALSKIGSAAVEGGPTEYLQLPTGTTAQRPSSPAAGMDASGVTGSAGAGGSGIVIIRYAGSQRGTGGTVTSSGGYTIHTFTSSGTYTA